MGLTILKLGKFPELPMKDGGPGMTVNHSPSFSNNRDTGEPDLDCVICDRPPDEDDGDGRAMQQGLWVSSDEVEEGFLLECRACRTRFGRECFSPSPLGVVARQVPTPRGFAGEAAVPSDVTEGYHWGPFGD